MRIAPVLFLVTGCGIFGVGAQTATAVAVNAAEAACLLAHATEGTDAARAACGIDPGRPAVQIIITPEARCQRPTARRRRGRAMPGPTRGGRLARARARDRAC